MAKRRVEIIIFVISLCLCLSHLVVFAKSTSDSKEPIYPERECSLEFSFCINEIAFSNVSVRLYKIADISSDYKYSVVSSFVSCGLSLNGIQTAREWNVIKTTLESYIVAGGIDTDKVAISNQEGKAFFEKLNTGLYLAIFGEAICENTKCRFDSALISLPMLDSDNLWNYNLKVNPKGIIIPPDDPETEKSFKVIKLWKDYGEEEIRPVEIVVEIFRNGVSYKTVVLSENNLWSYSWNEKDDNAEWTVIERDIPFGYVATVDKRETTFILTNTFVPDDSSSKEPPSTGDTSNVMFFVVIMILSGVMLIFSGVIGKKRSE